MDISLFFAQWWGVMLAVAGVAIIIRHNNVMAVMRELAAKKPSPSYLIGFTEFAVGLTFVLLYTEWVMDWRGVVTLFNWLLLVEGATYLLLPASVFAWVVSTFNKLVLYYIGGLISIAVGVYLLVNGFELL